ncbi:DUF3848 domain-containing protein [Ruminococcus sp.]|uniref:DUF3848 domain-containing protein n=1 Tax=Ruminococcus sp. TaxID=41978 RepID=UPI0025EA3E95|nr:DUF3848 domain-containing protein [Ruminococcus sp.]
MAERTYLVEKVERELDEYKNHLMSLSKEEIMLASYQTSIKECITGYIVSEIDTMSDELLFALTTPKNTLESLFARYMSSDLSLNNIVRDVVNDYMFVF